MDGGILYWIVDGYRLEGEVLVLTQGIVSRWVNCKDTGIFIRVMLSLV